MNFGNDSVVIQPALDKDLPIFTELYSDSRVMRYLGGGIGKRSSEKMFCQILEDMAANTPKQIFWSIKNNQSNTVVGFVGVVFKRNSITDCSMGIMIKPRGAAKGTAKIAMALFLKYLFTFTATQIVRSQTGLNNKAACFAAKSVGFKFSPFMPKDGNNKILHGIILKATWLLQYEK